jgi:DNA-binding XRE family transcriptional regulator
MDMDPEQVLAHLARALRHAREARGISRRQLAERCGLSLETIKKLEQGHGFHPRLKAMVRLALGLAAARARARHQHLTMSTHPLTLVASLPLPRCFGTLAQVRRSGCPDAPEYAEGTPVSLGRLAVDSSYR